MSTSRRSRATAGTVDPGRAALAGAFTGLSQTFHRSVTAARRAGARVWRSMAAAHDGDVLQVGELEIRPEEGLVARRRPRRPAVGRASSALLVALARREGRIVRREDLYALVWGAPLRDGDRSIDVYVHKLRVEARGRAAGVALHPHPRGLRLPLLAARALHTPFTTGPQARNKIAPRAAGDCCRMHPFTILITTLAAVRRARLRRRRLR